MPNETIDAFADHGVLVENAIAADLDEAHQVMHQLAEIGIDFDAVTEQLQHEGVQKFIEPFDALMQALRDKQQALRLHKTAR
jgi:transaldolase